MSASELPSGAWITFGGSCSWVTCSSSSTTQVTLDRVDAEFVHQHLAQPHAGGDRISAHADLLAFQVFRGLDASVRTHQHAAVVEAAHDKDRQADERRAVGTGDDVGGRRQFANIEFDVAHHAAEGADLRLDGDEFGIHALDGDGAVADGGGMGMLGDRDLERDFLGQLELLV
jgi:hypothetical protein